MEKLEGELFFPRENFPFPRLDSCLAERSEGRQSRSSLHEMEEVNIPVLPS